MSGMDIEIRAEWTGVTELQNKILYLSGSEAKSVFRSGVTAGAKLVKNYAVQRAPGKNAKKEIGYKTIGFTEGAMALIGPVSGKYWYRFYEYGTKTHGPRKKGRKLMMWRDGPGGKMNFARTVRGITARPFLHPAAEDHAAELEAAIIKGYKQMLEKMGL